MFVLGRYSIARVCTTSDRERSDINVHTPSPRVQIGHRVGAEHREGKAKERGNWSVHEQIAKDASCEFCKGTRPQGEATASYSRLQLQK